MNAPQSPLWAVGGPVLALLKEIGVAPDCVERVVLEPGRVVVTELVRDVVTGGLIVDLATMAPRTRTRVIRRFAEVAA